MWRNKSARPHKAAVSMVWQRILVPFEWFEPEDMCVSALAIAEMLSAGLPISPIQAVLTWNKSHLS